MEALDISIENCLGTSEIEQNDEDKGVVIEEQIIYEDLADPGPENTEPIYEEALIPDV